MKRVYKLLLIFVIPLIVAVAVGIYSYHRYTNAFYGYYLENAKYKDTEDLLNRYMMYNDTYFQEYLKKDVESEDGKALFTIAVYREFDEVTDEDDETTKTMHYTFYIYNVDYENVYRTIPGYSDTKEHKFNSYLATFKLTITDAADEDNVIEENFATNTNYSFKDYNFKGVGDTQKWQDGTKITSAYVKYVDLDTSEYEITENVNIKVTCIDSQYPSDEDGNNFVALEEDKTDFFTNVKKLDEEAKTYDNKELTKAYNGDYKAAGYTKYVIGKWMWWECLLGFALTLIITGSTALVWQNEDAKEKKRLEKLNEKK
ncbi:MAG: hypothetical protein J6Y42_02260 [Bacilli bacterium]|nr:hypothetical protein [Bacilli bacterium]